MKGWERKKGKGGQEGRRWMGEQGKPPPHTHARTHTHHIKKAAAHTYIPFGLPQDAHGDPEVRFQRRPLLEGLSCVHVCIGICVVGMVRDCRVCMYVYVCGGGGERDRER